MAIFKCYVSSPEGIPKRTACRCPAPQPLLTVVMPTSWLDPRSGLSCEGLKPPMNLGGLNKYSMGVQYYWDRKFIEMQNYMTVIDVK